MRCEADKEENKMRRRFLAFVCCFGMLASLLPCSVKANGRTTNVNLLETPEEVAECPQSYTGYYVKRVIAHETPTI